MGSKRLRTTDNNISIKDDNNFEEIVETKIKNKWWCDTKITNPHCRIYENNDTEYKTTPFNLYSTYNECENHCNKGLLLPSVTHSIISQFVNPGDVQLSPNFYSRFSTIIDTNQKIAKKLYKLWKTDQKIAKEEFLKKKNIGATRFALDALLLNSENIFEQKSLLEFIFQNKSIFNIVNSRGWRKIFGWYPFIVNADYIKSIIHSDVLKDYKLLFLLVKYLKNVKGGHYEQIVNLDDYRTMYDFIRNERTNFEKELFSDNINNHEKAKIIFEALLEDQEYGTELLLKFGRRNMNIIVMVLENLLDFINPNVPPIRPYSKWLNNMVSFILKYDHLFKRMNPRNILILFSLYKTVVGDNEQKYFIDTIINSDVLKNDETLMRSFMHMILPKLNIEEREKIGQLLISKYNELFNDKKFQDSILKIPFEKFDLEFLVLIPWHPEQLKKFNILIMEDLMNKITDRINTSDRETNIYLKKMNDMLTHDDGDDLDDNITTKIKLIKYKLFKLIDDNRNYYHMYPYLKLIMNTEFNGPDKFEKAYKLLKEDMIFFPMDLLLPFSSYGDEFSGDEDYIDKWKNICRDEKNYENENKNIAINCRREFPFLYQNMIKEIGWENMPKFSDDEISKYKLDTVSGINYANENGNEDED